jgi:hypothetical protein
VIIRISLPAWRPPLLDCCLIYTATALEVPSRVARLVNNSLVNRAHCGGRDSVGKENAA